ncbi:DNA polymerase Y family protein [Parafrigoribacterium mesophilum]|uniref:DNA polymerase Y family protein n=1 Tax=Parafrigoribacterium mesophilum TaxID=433646 RepID=UPI0031FDE729
MITRTMVLWCPDWPIIAAVRAHDVPQDAPIAVIDRGLVFACSAAARREGVKRGLRLREAQARCPQLLVFDYEASVDHRSFEPIVSAIEEVVPSVQLLRPGTCALRARGPSRYYGSEEEAALWLLDVLDAQRVPGARVGVADGPFTAERAARSTHGVLGAGTRIRIVPEGQSAQFLGPLPIGLLEDGPGGVGSGRDGSGGRGPRGQRRGDQAPELVPLLRRLGVHTLADFAALPAGDVLGRFGATGAQLHALAAGLDSRAVVPREPPEELDCVVEFEPALDRVDQVTFGIRAPAGRFLEKLTAAKLVCTGIAVEIVSQSGRVSQRSWLHPRSFTAADVVDRVRWQLQGADRSDSPLDCAVIRVRVTPESVDAIGNHEEGLWGAGPDERIHHALSRVQSMLGHDGVLTAAVGGGRTVADRQNLVPWGDRGQLTRPAPRPWPGHLPAPAPSTVFDVPRPVHVLTAEGTAVRVDERGILSAPPAQFSDAGRRARQVSAWAGPWPVDERWWDAASARRVNRFQLVDEEGTGWLLVLQGESWWAEARYD